MQAQSISGTDPELIKLYQSISTILRNKSKAVVSPTVSNSSKPYFTKEERGGLFGFDGLSQRIPFLNNVISPANKWTSANSSERFLHDKVCSALYDVSKPIIERCRDKWGAMIKTMDIGYRAAAPFCVKVSGVDYVFQSDAVLFGINYAQGNQDRLVEIFLQEGNKDHPRRGLCQIQRPSGKELIIEAAFCVYPGYSSTRVFSLRDKSYFNNIESNLG